VTEELVLPRRVADEMIEHSRTERPNEACGILALSDEAVVACYPMTNVAASPVRYSLDSKEQLQMYRELEEKGWELGGLFHSHTRTEAYPSPTDVREAVETVPYVIVSLRDEAPMIRAFRIIKKNLGDVEGEIEEIPVVIR
jgi:proteasome lid subunit RPN8/RPN11